MQFTKTYAKRDSFSVGSKQAQTLLTKALLEFGTAPAVAAVAATSKSIQNSSLSANIAMSIVLDQHSIHLFLKDGVFDPASSLPLQFIDTLTVASFEEPPMGSCVDPQRKADLLNFFNDMKHTKYFCKSLKSLTFIHSYNQVVRSFFNKPTPITAPRESNAASLLQLAEAWAKIVPGEDSADRPYASFDNLQHLELKYFLPTCETEVDFFNNGLPSLTSFTVRSGLHLSNARLGLLYKCRKITALSFGVCFNLTDDKFNGIAALKNLTSLNLSMMNQIGPKALEYVAGLRDSLKYLDISLAANLDDEATTHVAQLENLEVLHMEHLQKLTDDGMDRLFGDKSPMKTNPHLFHQLRDLHLDASGSSVTEAGYLHVQHVTERTQLRLASFKQCAITDRVVREVFGKHAKEHYSILAVLDFSDCKLITNAALIETIASLENLVEVDFSGCEKISDDGVQSVLDSCQNLKKLNVKSCANVTDTMRSKIQQRLGH